MDPAVASAVTVTTFTDVIGFLLYLGIASAALSLIVRSQIPLGGVDWMSLVCEALRATYPAAGGVAPASSPLLPRDPRQRNLAGV